MDNDLESKSKVKQSEKIFLDNTEEAEAEARKANRIYNTVSKGLLSFGIAFAVALPLSMLSNPSDNPDTIIESETHHNYATTPNDEQPVRLEAVIKNIVGLEPHEHTISTDPDTNLLVNIATPDIEIRAVPPLNREWHRAVFRNKGDSLWALPSVDLVIRLNELNACDDGGCSASFDLESERYVGRPITKAFLFQDAPGNCGLETAGRCLDFSPEVDAGDDTCKIVPNRTAPVTLCKFKQTSEAKDLCLWMRMSTTPTSATLPAEVALDVKWNDPVASNEACIDRLNQTIRE